MGGLTTPKPRYLASAPLPLPPVPPPPRVSSPPLALIEAAVQCSGAFWGVEGVRMGGEAIPSGLVTCNPAAPLPQAQWV